MRDEVPSHPTHVTSPACLTFLSFLPLWDDEAAPFIFLSVKYIAVETCETRTISRITPPPTKFPLFRLERSLTEITEI